MVQTHDGRSLRGEIAFTNGTVQVIGTNTLAQTVAFIDLRALKFDTEAEPSPGGTIRGQGTGLLGYYFNDTNHTRLATVRLDETIDFDWGLREPAAGVQKDQFGVLWTGELVAPFTGVFTFYLAADDGGRLFIGDTLVVEAAHRPNATETSGTLFLEGGRRTPLQLRGADGSGPARVRLAWSATNLAKAVIPKEALYPASFQEQHRADMQSGTGLLATYFSRPDLSGDTFTRREPGIELNFSGIGLPPGISNSFSVRWTGQLLAEHAETYTFHVTADEGARLWINDKLIVNEWGQYGYSEYRRDITLEAGERYDLVFETRNTSGSAIARLLWSSPSTPKAAVPATHLFASRPATRRGGADPGRQPPGVLLRNGTFLAGAVERGTDTSLRLAGRFRDHPLSTWNVARIYLQPLARSSLARLEPGRAGALLAKGDFFEGELRSLTPTELRMNSILFGTQKYDPRKDVLAVVLRDHVAAPAPVEVQLTDQSLLRAGSAELRGDRLWVRDDSYGAVSVTAAEVTGIQCQGGRTAAR